MSDEQPLRIVIVDDEAPARSRMRDLLADCGWEIPLAVTGEAASGRAALELLADRYADVVILDIRMPEMDGIEVAQHLQRLDEPPSVIFATAYDAYAIRAFEVHAVDYLLKPIRLARLKEALARAHPRRPPQPEALRKLQRAPRAFLSVPERGKVHLIPIDDVVYLKAELKYLTVRTPAREYLMEESLTRLEQEYAERFVRVHVHEVSQGRQLGRPCNANPHDLRAFDQLIVHWEHPQLRGVCAGGNRQRVAKRLVIRLRCCGAVDFEINRHRFCHWTSSGEYKDSRCDHANGL